MDQASSSGGGETWSDAGYTLKVESSILADGLEEGYERKGGVKDDTNILARVIGGTKLPLIMMVKM